MTFPDQNKQSKAQFLRKLAYYLTGIAIGFVLLGFFQRMGRIEAAKREQDAKQQAEATSSLFPPPPGDAPGQASPAQQLK